MCATRGVNRQLARRNLTPPAYPARVHPASAKGGAEAAVPRFPRPRRGSLANSTSRDVRFSAAIGTFQTWRLALSGFNNCATEVPASGIYGPRRPAKVMLVVSSPSLHGEKHKPEATGREAQGCAAIAAVAPKLGGKRPHDHEDNSDRGEAKRNRNQRQQHVNGRIPSAEPRAPDRKIAVRQSWNEVGFGCLS